MSGGVLTDYHHDLYRIIEWAEKLDYENLRLAYMLRRLYEVLCKYDRYLSGDTDEAVAFQKWREFSADFIEMMKDLPLK